MQSMLKPVGHQDVVEWETHLCWHMFCFAQLTLGKLLLFDTLNNLKCTKYNYRYGFCAAV